MARKPKDPVITAKPNNNKMNDHVARLRVVQEVSSRNSSASWNSSCTFSTEQSVQDQPRPPVYNVEDYAGSLRKFGKRGPSAADLNGDSSPDPKQTEMTLKEFTSTTELLDKLSADLKLAYFSFVQEFVGDPIDGVTLLLELLKTIQQSGTQTKCTPANQRRVTLDENACLQCLKYCLRCQDAARKLAISPAGLYTLAACIMSTVNQSRLLTLELLTKACCESGTADGHNTVSDAMSTMRLRFAEPVRFRFLVGMMSGNGTSGMELLLAGLKFINAFTETCPDLQTKFYVQAELKQAGFKPAGILKNISNKSPLLSSVSDEIYRWQKNFINVESLKRQHDEVSREAKSLREKVAMLEKKIHVLQDEKRAMVSSRNNNNKDAHHHSMTTTTMPQKTCNNNKIDGTGSGGGRGGGGGGGNSAEDEGISSSEQDDCEDDVPAAAAVQRCKDDAAAAAAVQPVIVNGSSSSPSYGGRLSSRGGDAATTTGTTVDGVLEDFDKVINDASTESGGGDERRPRRAPVRYYRAAAVATVPEDDAVIVPTRIVPEPPRRSRSLFVNKNFEVNPFFEEEDDDDDDDDMMDEDESADSECAYDEEDDEVDVQQRVQMMKPGGQTFHSVQKQIERFSELALQRRRDEDRVKADLLQQQQQQQQQGRRKSIYDVFGDGRPRVGRSASTRIAVDSGIPPVVPRFGGGNRCGKSVYLPAAAVAPQVVAGRRSDAAAPADDAAAGPKAVAFAAARGLHCNNNAGLYSGYDQDPAAKCGSQTSNPSGHRTSNGGDRQPNIVGLHRVNLSVSAGKLTDFPSGLY